MMRMIRTPFLVAVLAATALGQQMIFSPPVGTPVDGSSSLLLHSAVGDVDGDGDVDVVVGGRYPPPAIQVVLNNGDGSFAPAVPFSADPLTSLRMADLDADGDLDLVQATNGNVRVALGNGDGTFASSVFVFGNQDVQNVDVGDATGDGVVDIISMAGLVIFGPGDIVVLPGNGDGSFGAPITVDSGLPGQFPVTADVGDVNGDGFPDILVVLQLAADGQARLYLGTIRGTFVNAVNFGVGPAPMDGRLEDLDDDGDLDMLLAGSPGFGVKLGRGDGTFGSTAIYASDRVNGRLGLADLDGDGELDVALHHGGSQSTVVFRGNGDGGFVESVRVTGMTIAEGPRAADFDLDGQADLGRAVSADTESRFEILTNRTYGAAEPWSDLGFALAESEDGLPNQPIMWGHGDFVGGTTAGIVIHRNEVTSGWPYLVLGLSAIFAPFDGGGIWVPNPDILAGPLVIPFSGSLELAGSVPTGVPAGVQLWLQTWFVPDGFATQYAATTAIEITTP